MKKRKLSRLLCYVAVAVSFSLSSCTVTQYVSRNQEINRRSMMTAKQTANLEIDLSKKINAKSGWQISSAQAIREAEYMALQANGIDVVVDPIYRITVSPIFNTKDGAPWWSISYRAELTGYAAKYKDVKSETEVIDEFKNLSFEDIEKYKLATDPNFAVEYFKAKSATSDISQGNVVIGGGNTSAQLATSPVVQTTEMGYESKITPFSLNSSDVVSEEYQYAKELKKAKDIKRTGAAFLSMGVPMAVVGVICATVGNAKCQEQGRLPYYRRDQSAYDSAVACEVSGISLSAIGGAFTIIGAVCYPVGDKKLKKLQDSNYSFNFGVSEQGHPSLSFNF